METEGGESRSPLPIEEGEPRLDLIRSQRVLKKDPRDIDSGPFLAFRPPVTYTVRFEVRKMEWARAVEG